jgi:GNAT superfamily N-acetyltransferase
MYDILRANKSHSEAISLLFNEYRIFYKMPSDINSVREFVTERIGAKDSLIYIAQSNNDVLDNSIGCSHGFIQIYPSFSSVAMKPIWILNDLYVTSNSRRSGCGSQLMKHIEEEAKINNIFSIKLATAFNNTKAIPLYNTLGYKLNSSFKHYSRLIT